MSQVMRGWVVGLLLLALVAVGFSFEAGVGQLDGSPLMVNGQLYEIKGILYDPTPLGETPLKAPWGDYFSDSRYEAIWHRDLPLIAQMGANTLRIAKPIGGTNLTHFLDVAHGYGLKVLVSAWSGLEQYTPVRTLKQREELLTSFVRMARYHAGHPGLLGFAFGTDVNAPWNGYLAAFSDAFSCGWTEACLGSHASAADPCAGPVRCVYQHMFAFLDEAARKAKAAMAPHKHVVTATFRDMDIFLKRLADYGQAVQHLDAWAVAVYKGYNFGDGNDDFLASFELLTRQHRVNSLIISETGVDVYDDPCGRSQETPCYNTLSTTPRPYGENQVAQAEWDAHLAALMLQRSPAEGKGRVLGGFIRAWVDEVWRSAVGVALCWSPAPYGTPGFDPGQCQYKAHVDCPNRDLTRNALCGHPASYTYDLYENAGWFGIARPRLSPGGDIDSIELRQVYRALRAVWAPFPSSYISLAGAAIAFGLLMIAVLLWMLWSKRRDAAAVTAQETRPLLAATQQQQQPQQQR